MTSDEKEDAQRYTFDKAVELSNFAKAELEILKYWEEKKAFETSVALSVGRPEFSFYDGRMFGLFFCLLPQLFPYLSFFLSFVFCIP